MDKKTRDVLLGQVKLLVRFESKFDTVLDRFPNESGKEKKVLKMVRVVDKILARLILSQLNHMLKKEKINQMAYDLLKSDFNWIINK